MPQHLENCLDIPEQRKNYAQREISTCNSKFFYIFTEMPFDKIYIGKATCSFKQRISEHESSIKMSEISRNFINHPLPVSSLRFQGDEQIMLQRGGDID